MFQASPPLQLRGWRTNSIMGVEMKKMIAVLLLSSILISGCASVYNSGGQTVLARHADGKENIEVEIRTPSGAYTGKLPATIVAESAHSGVQIRVTDKCYDKSLTDVKASVTPAFWSNFLLFYMFPFGMAVDAATGKMWKYDSNALIHANYNCQ